MKYIPRPHHITLPHGEIEGVWVGPENPENLIIITNGHNGFYSYGMFPWIQEQLAGAGLASFSYNFSHGGTRGDEDVFSDLDRYSRNCMRLETADLIGVGTWISTHYPAARIWLLAHSMGSIPTIFGACELRHAGMQLSGLILLAPVSRLDFWPDTLIEEWKKTGTITMYNRRTGQDLPHGPDMLREILEADQTWNMEQALSELNLPLLVIHGKEDEAVLPDHGKNLVRWARGSGSDARLIMIERTGHTFGTKHPFAGPVQSSWNMIQHLIQYIQS